ncbi:hypothetical protein ILUMI_16482 [Ignelater luminosus]|uniref:Mos1 transposase HTH domain-containing protein n=1 Tax=Ignelater luminosus TaxID=2038154 RepID=A0A8K0CR75_IGNLU|nr:hypothetical protein ILUMI_16482 [Ignelater luminosus]
MKFFTKEGNSPTDIKDSMSTVYDKSAPSYKTIEFWSKQFKSGRESLEDDARSGRPNSAIAEENIETSPDLVVLDSRHIVQTAVADTLLNIEKIGIEQYELYVSERNNVYLFSRPKEEE